MVKASDIANGPRNPQPPRQPKPQKQQIHREPEPAPANTIPQEILDKCHVPNFDDSVEYIMGEDGPVPANEYSPTWNYIKRTMRELGFGYMLRTPEQRKRLARHVGGLTGLGVTAVGFAFLKRLGLIK